METTVLTRDGWRLQVQVDEPEGTPCGTALLAHAMAARRSEFERPHGASVAALLRARGWRVVSFDFRGHGQSGPGAAAGGRWTYDDLVEADLPALHDFARGLGGSASPLVLVGHSLGGHVGLAAQGRGLVAFDAIVAVAANVWLPELEPHAARWLVKRATMAAIARLCARVGRFPSRRLGFGSDDEAKDYFDDLTRFTRTGRWCARDGTDYLAQLAAVRAPVLALLSDGDRLNCARVSGERFLARCGGPTALVRVQRADDGGPAPGHMEIVTGGRIERAWLRVEQWMRAVTA